jgi:putative chitobiose transport system permease protein
MEDAMQETTRVGGVLATRRRATLRSSKTKRIVTGYLFLLPALIILAVFLIYPVVYGAILSFYNYNILSPAKFAGFANFRKLAVDPTFRSAIINSLKYLLIVPPIQVASLALAILVNRRVRGISFFRAAFYIPVITAAVVVAVAWKWIFDLNYGLLNAALRGLGILEQPIGWLTEPRWALWSIMFVTFWRGLGFYMVVYLAGLQGIPPELEEAAAIDGAGRWQRIRYVTIPLIMPTVAFCTIWSSIAALKVFDEILVMSGPQPGGPANSTMVVNVLIWRTAFLGGFNFGYAAAQGLVLAGIIMVFTLLNIRFFRSGLEGNA